MRSFVIRARKASTDPTRIDAQVGGHGHFEILAHTLSSAVFLSNAIRPDVELYIVLDSSSDFPRTLRFASGEKLSLPGFDERALIETIKSALKQAEAVTKDGVFKIANGIEVLGYGFDRLVKKLAEKQQLYLLDKKGEDVRETKLVENAAFILSDHIPLPKNSILYLERLGAKKITLGPKMLFASHCVVLVNNELDRKA